MFDDVTKSIRVLSAAAVERANSGHPGMPLGMADIGVVLYKNFLKVSNKHPDWINRDRFVLSAGHGSMLLYSLLHFNGFDISLDEIKNFRQLGSKTAGHPEKDFEIGIDTTTGPLGQGFANGVGLAVAERYLASVFGEDVVDHHIYGIVSDGDLMEGISTEAAELAGLWELGKLIYFFDDNNISIDGNVTQVSVTNQKQKFISMGWDVLEIDAHNENEIIDAVESAKSVTNKPTLIISKSTIGKYAPNKENTSGVHGSPLGENEFELFLQNIGFLGDPFIHDSEIYSYFDEKRADDNSKFDEWKANLESKLQSDKNFRQLWNQFNNFEISEVELEWSSDEASRVVGGKILNEYGLANKFIIGGSADLAASTKQIISDNTFGSNNFGGNSIEFGIREHAMGGIVNGLALHSNLMPYGSTFLVFSDYMRPSMRLASLMNVNSLFIFTHDSIYLGEDGPTHQPIEHLMSLRLIPNLDVIRPSNSMELIHSYRYALEKRDNPKSIILSRQDMKFFDNVVSYKDFQTGAYEFMPGKDITLVATGSELELAVEISKNLKDLSVQIISAPILNKINKERIESLNLNQNIFTLELGRSTGWDSYIENITRSFSIDSFGESAPIEDLTEKYNFSAEKISDEIRSLLN
ncbi:transketolase [Acidimicrobiaceae bacterium]|nr:transketolase [Acidimicrobiaceae bacterium]